MQVKLGSDKFIFNFYVTPIRVLLMFFALVGLFIMLLRFVFGLQFVTNLDDSCPWGFWIAFDVMCGVALAGGGYGMALLVYVLHIDYLRPVVRGAMLTSLIGYLLVMVGLFLDIGRWFNFWCPIVSWGYESVLFEVFWCISAYTIVQVLEFCEVVTERFFCGFHKYFVRMMPMLVIVGIAIPTMHQASLGELYVLLEGRLHPLWWSPIIFLFFLLSSFFVGPAMIMIETAIAAFSFKHVVSIGVLQRLSRIGGVSMIIYLVLRFGDLFLRDKLGFVFEMSFASAAFWVEVVVGLVLPLVIIFSPLSKSRFWLVVYGVMASFGVFLNRLNVVITGMSGDMGSNYYPSICEILVSVGLVSIGLLAYFFVCENFKIVEDNTTTNKLTQPKQNHS
ncbi:MAG: Ni/Fe-hydrogenase cytochrome b subunit [Planctomycetaceae bacterium]|jgi:Ni/Fe-hydrogenase subunit HybB-like protein|nr:Ni/Fe-hydrogenase cytochrome b subunit [Planctomycetaceae bacterium]